MSSPTHVLWPELIANLEAHAGTHVDDDECSDFALIRRAHNATTRLRRISHARLVEATLDALGTQPSLPPQLRAFAKIHWPLVVTTNYDDLYLKAIGGPELSFFDTPDKLPILLGRSNLHCRQILAHLDFPTQRTLWATQGFIATPAFTRQLIQLTSQNKVFELQNAIAPLREVLATITDELVIGHAEYRAVTHREPQFRRTFAEVFRRRSLLFLGAGLTDRYFLGLFDEALETSGEGTIPHFALLEEGRLDAEFMKERYNIELIEYPAGAHECVELFLKELSAAIERPRSRITQWAIDPFTEKWIRTPPRCAIEITRRTLPTISALDSSEAMAISVGRDGASSGHPFGRPMYHENEIAQRLNGAPWVSSHLIRLSYQEYAVVGRDLVNGTEMLTSRDRRSLGSVRTGVAQLLKAVARSPQISRLYVPLIGVGKLRVFPPWMGLIAMLRGYRDVLAELCDRPLKVTICLVAPDVEALLRNGSLNPVEVLNDDRTRLRVEVEGEGTRTLYVSELETPVALAARLELPLEGWQCEILPRSFLGAGTIELSSMAARVAFDNLGTAPGSLVRYSRQ